VIDCGTGVAIAIGCTVVFNRVMMRANFLSLAPAFILKPEFGFAAPGFPTEYNCFVRSQSISHESFPMPNPQSFI
jgi:hypothetical protein